MANYLITPVCLYHLESSSLLEVCLSRLTHNIPHRGHCSFRSRKRSYHCSDITFPHINPPNNEIYMTYLKSFIGMAGVSLRNPEATTECLYCQMTNATRLLAIYGVEFERGWHNFGYLTV
jgi:hypothetical protein